MLDRRGDPAGGAAEETGVKILIVLLFAAVGALAGEIWVLVRQRNYWKDSAMGNARGRHDMYKELREREGLINQNAARYITQLEAENRDLRDELQRQKNLCRRALEQMDRRKRDAGI